MAIDDRRRLMKGQARGHRALRYTGAAALIAVLAASASPALGGQLAKDPVLNHALRQAAGMRSFGDMLMDLASSAAELGRVSADLTGRIRSARTRYWSAFPNGADLPEARAQFERLLASKDRVYLSNAITGGAGTAVMQLLGANVDGGVHPGAAEAFGTWAEAVRMNLTAEGRNLATFLGGTSQADIARFKELIDRADPLYKAYVVRRDLEEFRMQNKTPPGWDAEAWRLAMLSWRTVEDGLNIPDPYGEALAAFERGAAFPRQCAAQLQTIFPVKPKSAACDCLHRLFTSTLGPRDMWQLETRFSAEQLLAAAVRRVGLHERATACIQ